MGYSQQQQLPNSADPNVPKLCINNCGSYGSPSTNDLCSLCFGNQMDQIRHKVKCYKALFEKDLEQSTSKIKNFDAASGSQINGRKRRNQFQNELHICRKKLTSDVRRPSSTKLDETKLEVKDENGLDETKLEVKDENQYRMELVRNATLLFTGSAKNVVKDIDQPKMKVSAMRCHTCKKRLTICTVFKCRCREQFCSLHRYSDKHNCSFDYKAAGREEISKANPLVRVDKVHNRI